MYLAGWCTAKEATELFEKYAPKAEKKKAEPLVRNLAGYSSGDVVAVLSQLPPTCSTPCK
jgi:hypothetical protein